MASIRTSSTCLSICSVTHIFVYEISSLKENILRTCVTNDISSFCCKILEKNDIEGVNESEKSAQNTSENMLIIDSNFSRDGKLFAVVTTSKHLLVFDMKKNLNECAFLRHLPKAPTRVCFDFANNILVADRSGSLRRFCSTDGKYSEQSQELLGHMSMLLDFCLSADERHILTVDRDEKLRVSRYPQAFVIESFGLGHTAFVNSVVELAENVAATAGGDSTINLWNTINGELVGQSEKIVDAPIRKLCVCVSAERKSTKLAVLSEESNIIHIFNYPVASSTLQSDSIRENSGLNSFRIFSASNESFIFDIVFDVHLELLICVGRCGIYQMSPFASSSNSELSKINLTNESQFIVSIKCAQDPLPLSQLYKTTGFENIKAYCERKQQKLQKRKRKICSESNNNEDSFPTLT